mmetsp:Transcript_40260/g.71914  ORF Transcript_40260/g.71914 Transcript_40260/m.71914 type:complete len:727 (-) Transcript_40260:87-2267(-)
MNEDDCTAFLTEAAVDDEDPIDQLSLSSLQFPGFDEEGHLQANTFPLGLAVSKVLKNVLKAQSRSMRARITESFITIFLGVHNQKMVLHMFWYAVLTYMHQTTGPEVDALYDKVAEEYTNIFVRLGIGGTHTSGDNGLEVVAHHNPRAFLEKDELLRWYPDILAQTVYSVCHTLFNMSEQGHTLLTQQFKHHLLRVFTHWMTGVNPACPNTEHWPSFNEEKKGPQLRKSVASAAHLMGLKTQAADSGRVEGKWKLGAHQARDLAQQRASEKARKEMADAFEQLKQQSKAKEAALRKALAVSEEAESVGDIIIPTFTSTPKIWYEEGGYNPVRCLPAGSEERGGSCAQRLGLGTSSPLIEHYMLRHHIRTTRTKPMYLKMATPSYLESTPKPVLYSCAAANIIQEAKAVVDKTLDEEEEVKVATLQGYLDLQHELESIDREQKRWVQHLVNHKHERGRETQRLLRDTDRIFSLALAEGKSRRHKDPSEVCNHITLYGSAMALFSRNIAQYPNYHRQRFLRLIDRMEKRMVELQRGLEMSGQEQDFLSKIQSFHDTRAQLRGYEARAGGRGDRDWGFSQAQQQLQAWSDRVQICAPPPLTYQQEAVVPLPRIRHRQPHAQLQPQPNPAAPVTAAGPVADEEEDSPEVPPLRLGSLAAGPPKVTRSATHAAPRTYLTPRQVLPVAMEPIPSHSIPRPPEALRKAREAHRRQSSRHLASSGSFPSSLSAA